MLNMNKQTLEQLRQRRDELHDKLVNSHLWTADCGIQAIQRELGDVTHQINEADAAMQAEDAKLEETRL